jgi:hypothetical protein
MYTGSAYLAVSSFAASLPDGWELAGSLTTVMVGGSGGTGGGGGSVGDGLCPVSSMWVDADRRAGCLIEREILDCLCRERNQVYQAPILHLSHGIAFCVRLVAENGAELECSVMTPFETPDGRTVWAPQMIGQQVATDEGHGTAVEWSTVVQVVEIGFHPVTHIDLGGLIFAAGKKRGGKRMFSHNARKGF